MGPVGAIWLSEILTAHLAAEPHPTSQTFLTYLLTLTPSWAATAAKHNVDTIIFWDVTCEKAVNPNGKPRSPFNHLWYLGDVCGLDPLFPASSVTAVANDLRHKGVKSVGSCVRPGDIVEAVGNRPKREDPEDWGYNLVDKMQRAKAIGIGDAFYVDTNILSITRGPIPVGPLLCIRDTFPTELIAFEITGDSIIGNPPSAKQDYYDHFYGYRVVTAGNPPPLQVEGTWGQCPYLIHPCDVTGPALDAMLPNFIAAVKKPNGARMVVRVQWDGDPYWTFVDKVYA